MKASLAAANYSLFNDIHFQPQIVDTSTTTCTSLSPTQSIAFTYNVALQDLVVLVLHNK